MPQVYVARGADNKLNWKLQEETVLFFRALEVFGDHPKPFELCTLQVHVNTQE